MFKRTHIYKMSVWMAGACFLSTAFAQTITVTPDNGTAVYRVGEPAIWSVSVQKDGAPLNGAVDYSILKGGLMPYKKGTVGLENGKATIEATRGEPGSLLLEVTAVGSTSYGGAIFNWEQIQPSAKEPSDFDKFWEKKIAELHTVPMNVQLEKVDVGPDVDYWKITMDGIRGSKIYGQIAKPKNSTGPLPATLQLQYAGVYPLKQEWVIGPAREGWLAMNIMAHDLPIDRDAAFYTELANGSMKTYAGQGNDDRDTSYFLRMFLSGYRAVDYLTQRPDWNGTVMKVTGASQGGMQSIAVAALHPAVTAVLVNVPAGCDHTGKLVGRDPGWPKWNWSGRPEPLEASKYYDVVNFARRVKCPALVGVGAIDRTCPPEGVVAMFNQIKGPKRLVIQPVAGHTGPGQEPFSAVQKVWNNELKDSNPLSME